MRRHATMGVVAFVLPLAISLVAVAQPKATGAANKADGGAAPAASAGEKNATKPAASEAVGASAGAADGGALSGAVLSTAPKDGGAPSPAATPGTMDGATYTVRLRDLEARVDELKDQIRRSHTRLSLLSDTIMSGGAAGARAEVTFENKMSSAFRLTRALIVMDGAVQYNRQDETGALSDQKEIPIYNGSVPPGDHTLQILLNYQGNGYGVFTYLRGYRFEVKSSHAFTVTEGKTALITAIGLEKGGVTTPLEQRPAIEWKERFQPIHAGSPSGPAPAAAPVGGAAASGSVNTTGTGASGSFSIGGKTK